MLTNSLQQQTFSEFLIVISSSEPCKAKDGRTYFKLQVTDGASECNLYYWGVDTYKKGSKIYAKGNVVKKDVTFLSATSSDVRYMTDEEISAHTELSYEFFYPIDGEAFRQAVLKVVNEFCSHSVKHFMEDFFTPALCEKMYNTPGGRSAHHSKKGGLIAHTLEMLSCFVKLAPLSMFSNIDKEATVCSILLHDVGKVFDYEETSSGEFTYSSEFYKQQHIFTGAHLFKSTVSSWNSACPDLKIEPSFEDKVTHCILSHHGQQSWGSPVVPCCAEAILIHYLDQISAKNDMFLHSKFGEQNKYLGTTPQEF